MFDANLILYVCIARGSVILADFSRDSDLELLGSQCVEKTPPHHAIFSQTIDKKSYTFLIDDPFVYFLIHSEDLSKSEALVFLGRIKLAFQARIVSKKRRDLSHVESHCFQRQFASILQEILGLKADLTTPSSPPITPNRNPSFDSGNSSGVSTSPFLDESMKLGISGEPSTNGNYREVRTGRVRRSWQCLSDDVLMSVSRINSPKRGSSSSCVNDLDLGKKMWKRHVVLVLVLDFFVCAVMFSVWLSICRGFQCLNA